MATQKGFENFIMMLLFSDYLCSKVIFLRKDITILIQINYRDARAAKLDMLILEVGDTLHGFHCLLYTSVA